MTAGGASVPSTTIVCPYCDARSHFTIVAIFGTVAWRAAQSLISAVWCCDGCNMPVAGKKTNSGDMAAEVYPKSVPRRPDFSEAVPLAVEPDLVEASVCLTQVRLRASAVMSRRSIQTMARRHGAARARPVEQIDWMVAQQLLTPVLGQAVHRVRASATPGAISADDDLDDVSVDDASGADVLDAARRSAV